MTIKESALRWWAAQTQKDNFVAISSEIHDRRQREYLVKEGFLFSATKGYWILKKPEDDTEDVFPLVYWQVIEKILSNLGPCSIRGKSALLLLSGDQKAQKHLSVKTETKSNRKISLPLGFDISLTYDADFDERQVNQFKIVGRKVSVDIPEKVLIDASKLKPEDEAKGFIAGTKFNKRMIEVLYAANPKPIIFKRLAAMAREAGRLDLVGELERIINTYTHYQVGRKENIAAESIAPVPITLKRPWVIRQEEQIRQFDKVLDEKLSRQIESIKTYPLNKLVEQAREYKKYDTYHSTTLEGYQVTPEQVEILLAGDSPDNKKTTGETAKEIENRMAIVGYSKAFDFVLTKAQADFQKGRISEDLIQDTYYHLFKPSVDAGIVDRITLVGYRNSPVYIRGTMYVPPSYEKVPELMAILEFSMNEIKKPVIKAILAHYLFVTIHPYTDGNGRTARLLMNYLLLASGYSWVTIRSDQRIEYFKALNTANLDGDILPFGEFIVEMLISVSKS